MFNKRLSTDYGIKDYYKYLKQNSNINITSAQYNNILSDLNAGIVDLIINEGLIYKPVKLQMTFCIRKIKKIPRIVDGKLVNNAPIDWKATNKLWSTNDEAKEKKMLIRFLNNHTFKNIFRIKIIKSGNTYKNKQHYKFKPARSFQRLLAKRILDSSLVNFDAYTLY